jgi:hypothetical protein
MILRSPDCGRLAGAAPRPGSLGSRTAVGIRRLRVADVLAAWRRARVAGCRIRALAEQALRRQYEIELHVVRGRRVARQHQISGSRQSTRSGQQPGFQVSPGHFAQAPAGALRVRPKERGERVEARLLFRGTGVLAAATSAAALSRPVQGERHSHLLPPIAACQQRHVLTVHHATAQQCEGSRLRAKFLRSAIRTLKP